MTQKKTDNTDKARQAILLLRKGFINELPERIHALEELVLQLNDPSYYQNTFDDLYRKVHSLKGSGGTYAMQIITSICHTLEDWLTAHPHSMSKSDINHALALIDLMHKCYASYSTDTDDTHEIEAQLARFKQPKHHPRVMLVESSRVVRDVCLSLLKAHTSDITTLDSGYQALGELLHLKFDVLITSKEGKDLNGLAVIAALRYSDSVNRHVRAILLTSKKGLKTDDALHIDAVLTKNMEMDAALSTAIDNLLK